MLRSIAMMQPYFFPYIGYFQLINVVDKFILYDNVSYSKQGWINRNKVLVKNADTTYIIVSVKHQNLSKLIKYIEIEERTKWREKTIKTIFLNYRKAPMFKEV